MSWQLEKYSEALDKDEFKKSFIQNAIEEKYFGIHPLKTEFILLKKSEKVFLRAMICLSGINDFSFFGLLEFNYQEEENLNEALSIFKNELLKWKKDNHSANMIGPINFSTWLPYRLFKSSDGGPLFSFEPKSPLLYSDKLLAAGFASHMTYHSKGYEIKKEVVDLAPNVIDRVYKAGYSFEPFKANPSEGDLIDLHRFSINSFSESYLSVPIDFNTFKMLYVSQMKKDDYSYSFFFLSPEKKRVGFALNFIENDYLIVKTYAIDKEHRGIGLSNGIFYHTLTMAYKNGITKAMTAMVRSGAQSESYGKKLELLWTHEYHLLSI